MILDTYDKVVKYLNSYKTQEYNIAYYENKMSGLKAISYFNEEKRTIQTNMISIYMIKIEEAQEKQKEVLSFIDNNFNEFDRLIIYKKYIDDLNYTAIGNLVGYSSIHIKRLINKAIYKYLAK